MGFPDQVSEFTSLYTPLMAPWLRILNSGPVYTSEAKRGSCPLECSTAPQPFRSERGKVVFILQLWNSELQPSCVIKTFCLKEGLKVKFLSIRVSTKRALEKCNYINLDFLKSPYHAATTQRYLVVLVIGEVKWFPITTNTMKYWLLSCNFLVFQTLTNNTLIIHRS